MHYVQGGQKKGATLIFFKYSPVKHSPILVIFDRMNPEKTSHQTITNLSTAPVKCSRCDSCDLENPSVSIPQLKIHAAYAFWFVNRYIPVNSALFLVVGLWHLEDFQKFSNRHSIDHMTSCYYFVRGTAAKCCDEYVCLCVCLSARISQTPEPLARSLPIFVARSSSGMLTIGRIAYRREGVFFPIDNAYISARSSSISTAGHIQASAVRHLGF